MPVRDSGIKFIFRELDVGFKPVDDRYKGGIKARDLDSMNCVLRFFAKIFGHTMEYKGKLYVVGDKSFKNFSLRHHFGGSKNNFSIDLAEKQILINYTKLSSQAANAFAGMKKLSKGAPELVIRKDAGTIQISKNDLEQVFNALAVPFIKRHQITLGFGKTESGKDYIITQEQFIEELGKIEHVLPPNPPANLPAELKEVSKKILEFLHHKIDLPTVEEDVDEIIFGRDDAAPKPPVPEDVSPKPPVSPVPPHKPTPPHVSPKPPIGPSPAIPGEGGKPITKHDGTLVLRQPFINIFNLNLQGKIGLEKINLSPFPKITVPFDFEGLRNFFVLPEQKQLALVPGGSKSDLLAIEPAFKEIQKTQKPQVPQSTQALKVIASHLIVEGREVALPVFNKLTLSDKAQVIYLALSHLGQSNSESLRNDVEFAIGQLVSHFVTANALGGHQEDVSNFLAILSQIGGMEFKYGDDSIVLGEEFFSRVNHYIESQKDLLGLPQGEGQGSAIAVPENQNQLLALSLFLAAEEFGLDTKALEAKMGKSLTALGEKGLLKRREENAIANIRDFLLECEGETVPERLMALCDNVKNSDLVLALQKEPSLRDELLVVLSGRKGLNAGDMVKLLEGASYGIEDLGLQEEVFLLLPTILEPKRLMAPTVAKAIEWSSVEDANRLALVRVSPGKFELPGLRILSSLDSVYGQARRLVGARHWVNEVHKKDLSRDEAKAVLKEVFNGDDPNKLKAFYQASANSMKDAGKLPIPLRRDWGADSVTATQMKEFLKKLAETAGISVADWKLPEGGKSKEEVKKPASIDQGAVIAKVILPNLKELTHKVPVMEQGRRLLGAHHWMKEVHKKPLSKDDAQQVLKLVFSGDDVNKLKEFYEASANSLKNAGSLPLPFHGAWGSASLTATELKVFLKELAEIAEIPVRDWKLPEGSKGKKEIEKPAAKQADIQLPDLQGLSPYDSPHGQARRLVGAYHWANKISQTPLSSEQAKGLLEQIFRGSDVSKAKAFYAVPANDIKDAGSLPKPMRAQWGDKVLTATEMKEFLKKLAEIAKVPSDDWQLPVGGKQK